MSSHPGFWAEMGVMFRELVNDLRGTFIQSYFQQPEHLSEPGTPMSPTQYMVNQELGAAQSYDARLDDLAARGGQSREPDRGRER